MQQSCIGENIYQKLDIYKRDDGFYVMKDDFDLEITYVPGNLYTDNTLCENTYEHRVSYNGLLQGDYISLSSNIRYRFIEGRLIGMMKIDVNTGYTFKTNFIYRFFSYFGKEEFCYFSDYIPSNESGPAYMEYDRDNKILREIYYLNGNLLDKKDWEDQIAIKLYW